MEIKRNFTRGIMNKDLDDRILPDGIYRDGLNVKAASSDGDDSGTIQNYLGNTEMINVDTLIQAEGLASTTNIVPIGSFTDTKNNYIYWFLTSDDYDIIFRYFENDAGVASGRLVLLENRVGTMKFNQQYLITGVNLIENLLFFTDGLNPPRRINVDKNYRDADISEDTVNVIVKPPLSSPIIELIDDTTIEENTIEDKFIRFAYRYKYANNEYSALSPFSKTAFEAQDFKFDFGTGRNESMRNKANSIDITVDLGSSEVEKVDIVAKDSRNNNTLIVTTIDKSDIITTGNIYKYKFKNNKVYTVLPQSQVSRLFDNVPLKAKAQDLIGSRIIYGNYKQFFDLKRPSGEPIVPNFTLSYAGTPIEEGTPAETFKAGRDYEVGIAYLDNFGRMTTVLESQDATTSIPITKAKDKNQLKVTINSRVPDFASKYRLFLKQNRGTYYNVLPISVYSEGLFVYFQIAKYDIDKVKTGDYIYIKSTPSGISSTTDKYKVLEAEQKVKDFIGVQKQGGQEEGFYLKLKVENNLFDEESFVTYKDRGQGITGYGGNKKNKNNKGTVNPLYTFFGFGSSNGYYQHVDLPIFYGKGSNQTLNIVHLNNSTITDPNSRYWFDTDRRFVVTVTGPRTFSFRDYRLSYDYETNVVMNSETLPGGSSGNIIKVDINGNDVPFAYISFDPSKEYRVGDTWRLNYRGNKYSINGSPIKFQDEDYYRDGGFTCIPKRDNSIVNNDLEITLGTVIKLRINDGYDQEEQRFISSGYYENIEEWFFEEKIYEKFKQDITTGPNAGKSDGAKTVFFRRGFVSDLNVKDGQITRIMSSVGSPNGYVAMFIRGYRFNDDETREILYLNAEIKSPANVTVLETEGLINNDAIYYELPTTYPVENGLHKKVISTDTDQSVGGPAVITIQDFNAITFGNGMESSIIEDDWNGPELLPSPRASAAIDTYEEMQLDNGLTYSGVFNESTSTNNLNEFNLSLANFKIIEKEYGPIQKLYARDNDLIIFQEDKVSKVLFEKNVLSDAAGGGSISSIKEVLGTQVPYNAEYGISNNPESFAKWGGDIFFTDQKRGAVLNLTQSGVKVASSYGMKNWFRDLFDDYPSTQKLGAFDPYEFKYVLASNDISIVSCELEVSNDDIFVSGDAFTNGFLFNITTNSSWSISVVNGSWLTLNATSGRGNRVITGTVTSNLGNTVNRVATITITYCEGLTKEITLTQSYTKKKQVIVVTTGDSENDGAKKVQPSYDFGGGSFTGAEIPIDLAGDYSFEDLTPDFVGQGFVPDSGDNVDIVADTVFENPIGDPTKAFNPNLGDKMYYLESDTLYDPSQGDALLAAATPVTPTLDVDKYKGQFTYNGTNDYLYIIIDYRNNLDMGDTVTGQPAPLSSAPESIRLNNTDEIGNYSITYTSDSTDIRFTVENANGAVIADSGYVSTPSSDVLNISKTLPGQDTIKIYNRDYVGSPTYSLVIGTTSLTSALISDDGYDTVSDACSATGTQTIYHNGDAALPIPGNTIYSDSAGANLFVGNNEYYKIGTNAMQINNIGVVISSTSCVCGESNPPVVLQSSINIVQNQDVSFSIQATNNPISFAAAGNCREFSMFGGNGGAVFAGQDCKTGLEKQVFVSTNETLVMCFFLNSVYKVAGADDATFLDTGGCIDTALPEGLSFEPLTGIISGSPTQSGNFTFTVTATNCAGTSTAVAFDITVQPEVEPNKAFFIDNTTSSATAEASCAITPSYTTMYHDGILSYPVIRDIIFEDESGFNRMAGGNLWYRMDNGVVIKVDNEGIIQDTFLCGIIVPTPPSLSSVSLAPGADSALACASGAFVTYYYTGSVGVNPGKLFTDGAGTTYAPAAWYKFEVEAGVFISLEWDGEQWGGSADCL